MLRRVATALCILLALASCEDPAAPVERINSGPLVVGVLPDQSREQLIGQYQPLIEYLNQVTGLELALIIHSSYAELLESFIQGELDLAWFGGLTFVEASASVGAVPLVMRDTDLRFTSYYIVAAAAQGETVADFAGKRFSFGPRLSTSGHLMPRYFLLQDGISPESFFASVEYSLAHDKSAAKVSSGVVDIAVANSVIIDSMFADGRLSADAVRILQTTPPFPDYVWATSTAVAGPVRETLRDAFLALDRTQESHAAILARLRASGFLPAHDRDFDEVRAAAEALEPGRMKTSR
ncbi:MAG: phosphate/phosphite/phosphonate ABC transporter substrate-binding protein [Gammaproteobacteria bacterium]|nr:phosphate/phosphite/phosphonate ABC transporter substrate-binding protein [Gammaproteobacteria bacterium]NNF60513.1 phosphate/phosphite/phosphonate ABC transporter substrate-binding protein [Gammaproteobacteria bacterium]